MLKYTILHYTITYYIILYYQLTFDMTGYCVMWDGMLPFNGAWRMYTDRQIDRQTDQSPCVCVCVHHTYIYIYIYIYMWLFII